MTETRGRVALVTGATSGIGIDIARQLASEEYTVIVTGRNETRGQQVVADLGENVHFIAADLTETGRADSVVTEVVDRFGKLDVLVNNAGIDHTDDLLAATEADIRHNFELNTFATIFMLQAAGRHMKTRQDGVIINVTSRLASIGVPTMGIYSAAKGAIRSLTTAAAVELAADNIRVNSVAPGMTETPLYTEWVNQQADPVATEHEVASKIPLQRIASTGDVSWAVSFLAHPRAAYLTGVNIPVDGGYTAQ